MVSTLNPDNLSPLIDPEKCRRCGSCCKEFRLSYPPGTTREKAEEAVRIFYLSGIKARIEPDPDQLGGNWLIFDHDCEHLIQVLIEEYPGGPEVIEYSCGLYGESDRPLICRLFPGPETPQRFCPQLGPAQDDP